MTGKTGITRIARINGMTGLQGLYPVLNKNFQHFSIIPMRDLSLSFLVLPQHDCNNFYPEGQFAPLSTWRSGLDKVSTEIQELSSTNCNFKDFQGACEP